MALVARGDKQEFGAHGFVILEDFMGDDHAICRAARVSYGAGTKKAKDDRALIRHLMRHQHSSPFEMVELKFVVKCPIFTMRQLIRHRTANVNEYSQRYSLVKDQFDITTQDQWRIQHPLNKQGSIGEVDVFLGSELSELEEEHYRNTFALYERMIEDGVAREQARKILPLSTYTECYWKCDLRNILNLIRLRADSHAQKEIRDLANALAFFVKALFPLSWEAFEDYVLGAVTLSAQDILILRESEITKSYRPSAPKLRAIMGQYWSGKSTERLEFIEKIKRLFGWEFALEDITEA